MNSNTTTNTNISNTSTVSTDANTTSTNTTTSTGTGTISTSASTSTSTSTSTLTPNSSTTTSVSNTTNNSPRSPHHSPHTHTHSPATNIQNRKVLVVLVSNGVSNLTQASNQRKAKMILHAKNTPYVEVDGMKPEHRDSRNELFAISGIRGNYPQFFFVHSNGATSFIGNYDKIEEINEDSGLPRELLDQHPEIQTWDKVFGDVVDSF